MTISEISINRPVFAWMLMFGLIIFGAISFSRMGISQMPDINFPVVNVSLRLDNAAPEMMETNVVDVIEDAVMGIEGLTRVSSSVSQGVANITCEFKLDHDIDVAQQEVQNRITQVQNLLPSALYPPVITKTNPEDQPILWVMVTADDNIPLYQEMIYARNNLKDQLSTIAGVGNIVLQGYVDPNLRVWLDPKRLKTQDLTASDIVNAIQNEQIEQPAGRLEAASTETNIRVLGEAASPQDFGKIRINTRSGSPNYKPQTISDVARIEEGLSDIRASSRFDGKRTVGLGIVKQRGANAVAVQKLVHERVELMRKSLLPGYHLDINLDTTKFIRDSVDELNTTLLLSALLTSIVCFFFLGSWSSTINVLLAIPTSIVGAFIILYFFGFTLNSFTLLGLSLAIGIVVDDAIMMLENIVRHFEMGKNRRQAALDGSKEITFAAIATTIAIAAIFIPVVFMQGVIGRFFYQYGITVTVAVFLSLLEALTLTPMRCSRFLHSAKMEKPSWVTHHMDRLMGWLAQVYHDGLEWALRHRATVVSISVIIFSLSMGSLYILKKELIPPQDQSLFLLNLKTPVGTSLESTDKVFQTVEEYLRKQPEISDNYSTVGNYENNNVVNAGTIYVILKDKHQRKLSQREMMDKVRQDLKQILPQDTEIFTQDLSLTGLSASRGYPVEFVLVGPDWKKLATLSKDFAEKFRATGLVEDLNSDFQEGMPTVLLTPDRDRAADHGVSTSEIGQEVGTLIGGYLFSANTEYPKSGHRYNIRVRGEPDYTDDLQDFNYVFLRNNRANSELVPVPQTVNITQDTSPQLISRVNRFRAVPFYGNIKGDQSQKDVLEAATKIAKDILPTGYHLDITGNAAAFQEAFSSLIFALILGVIVAYMVLASQFNSFIHPVSVLMALPFSLSGALLALYICHQSLSLFSMIGLVLLMGIVKKNSILLVDFTNRQRAEGLSPHDALLKACPIRLRPILMTSVATVAGALPAALNFGAGAETRVPMAISVIGGVSVSTLLTLFVVPCVYSYFTRFERPDVPEGGAS